MPGSLQGYKLKIYLLTKWFIVVNLAAKNHQKIIEYRIIERRNPQMMIGNIRNKKNRVAFSMRSTFQCAAKGKIIGNKLAWI